MTVNEPSPEQGDSQDVFASGAYWREYYSSLGHENREVGEFLLDSARSLSTTGGLKILDAGCGPTILYWGAFLPGDNDVHGFDISPTNIRASRRCIEAAGRGEFDMGLVEAAGHALRVMGLNATPEHHLGEKARQVSALNVGDLRQRWSYASAQFDLVQSCFAFENLPDWDSFDVALSETCRVIRPGGCLALVNSANGASWICDNRRFPTLFVTAGVLAEKIQRVGLRIRSMREVESTDTDWRTQGYNQLLLTCAVKMEAA